MAKPFQLWICLLLAVMIIFFPFLIVKANDSSQLTLGEPGILPNSFWYNFEIIKERIVLIFTFSSTAKANKILSLSTERIAELNKMAEIGDIRNSQKAINRYDNFLNEMKAILDDCNSNANQTKNQIEKSRQVAAWQIEQLLIIQKTAPKEIEPDINSAISKSTDIINLKCD